MKKKPVKKVKDMPSLSFLFCIVCGENLKHTEEHKCPNLRPCFPTIKTGV